MTPSTQTTPTRLVIPDELQARPTAASAAGRRRCAPRRWRAWPARAPRVMGTSHRQAPVKALVGEIRAGLRELFALPDGYEVALGNGGATAFWDAAAFGLVARARAAPDLRRVLRRSSPTVTAGAPFLADPLSISAEPGDAPDPAARPRGGDGADVLAWAHNETSTGVMAPVLRPPGSRRRARADRRDLRRRRPAGGRSPRSTPTTSRRRRASAPTAGCGSRCSAPPRRSGSRSCTPPSAGSRSSSRCTRRSRTRSRTRPTTRPRSRRCSCSPTRSRWMLARRRPGLVRGAHARMLRAPLRLGAATRLRDAVRGRPGKALAGRRHDRLRRRGRRCRRRRDAAREQIVDVEPYRKLGRNQLRIGMFPAVDTADVQALTGCIDWVVERLAQ